MLKQFLFRGFQRKRPGCTQTEIAKRLPGFRRGVQYFPQRPAAEFVRIDNPAFVFDFVPDIPECFLEVLGRCAFVPVPENVLERIAAIERQMPRYLDALDSGGMSAVVGGVVYGVCHVVILR